MNYSIIIYIIGMILEINYSYNKEERSAVL